MPVVSSNRPIILASRSPRRKRLLEQIGLPFSVVPSAILEHPLSTESPDHYVKNLSELKAAKVSIQHPDSWVIGADTIVRIGESVLGKPGSKTEARDMLSRLSGRTHSVLTGYTICCQTIQKRFSEAVRTDVTFKRLTDAEIRWYTGTQEPFDKAGAYGIQGIGMFMVKRINGSYTNVVGLPVCEVMSFFIKEAVLSDLQPPTQTFSRKPVVN